MITFNVFARVFKIKSGNNIGTAFAIDYRKKQYLITAFHIICNPAEINYVELQYKNGWKVIEVDITGFGDEENDVIVLSPKKQIAPEWELPLSKGRMVIGQDVYFLGFPYNMTSEVNDEEWHLPYPLVKKACLSGSIDNNKKRIWLLDGINNPGFSGGPVVFHPVNSNNSTELYIMGLISGFRFNEEKIIHNGYEIDSYVKANTGIIYAISASNILEIIEKNENGFKL